MSEKIYEDIVHGWSGADRSRFRAKQFLHLEETGSTNDEMMARARAGLANPFDLIAADFQTRGRGRRGDRWEAPIGRNLLFSIALPLDGPRETWPRLPHLTAFVIGKAIEAILEPGKKLQAKWPNDLLFNGQKLAGILVEISLTPRPIAIVGVGINVNLRREELPPELRSLATSLYEILDCESNRWFLLGLVIQGFLNHFPNQIDDFNTVLAWVTDRDFLIGKKLRIRSGLHWLEGTAAGIGPGGELLLETGEGTRVEIVSAEEIQFK